jgi:major membrane immunogen (membrane-anchored lipoprotein)
MKNIILLLVSIFILVGCSTPNLTLKDKKYCYKRYNELGDNKAVALAFGKGKLCMAVGGIDTKEKAISTVLEKCEKLRNRVTKGFSKCRLYELNGVIVWEKNIQLKEEEGL